MSDSDQNYDALIDSFDRGKNCKCYATVLIVDDHEFNLIPLNMFLKNKKIISIKATNGRMAVEMFEKDLMKKCCNIRIQLIFMDLEMPVLDGFEAAKQIIDILKR